MDYHKVNSNGKERDNLDMDHGRKHYKSHIDCCSWMKTQDIIRDIIEENYVELKKTIFISITKDNIYEAKPLLLFLNDQHVNTFW